MGWIYHNQDREKV